MTADDVASFPYKTLTSLHLLLRCSLGVQLGAMVLFLLKLAMRAGLLFEVARRCGLGYADINAIGDHFYLGATFRDVSVSQLACARLRSELWMIVGVLTLYLLPMSVLVLLANRRVGSLIAARKGSY